MNPLWCLFFLQWGCQENLRNWKKIRPKRAKRRSCFGKRSVKNFFFYEFYNGCISWYWRQINKYGIKNAHQSSGAAYGDRISRLLLFSNDGADRFYRHIEQLLEQNAPRLLGCKLNVDAGVLGELFLGKDKKIKIIMAEHKDVVSGVLRAIAACRNSWLCHNPDLANCCACLFAGKKVFSKND